MARDLVTDPVTLNELDEGKVMETGLKEVSRHSGLFVLAVSGMYKFVCNFNMLIVTTRHNQVRYKKIFFVD